MIRKSIKRAMALMLSGAVFISMLSMGGYAQAAGGDEAAKNTNSNTKLTAATNLSNNEAFSIERLTNNYTKVSASYRAKTYQGDKLEYQISDYLTRGAELLTEDNYAYGNPVAKVKAGDEIAIEIDVKETALYNIGFDYLSFDQSILPIELSVMTDGEYAFYEMRSLSFETTWIQSGEKSLDRYGNEIVALPDKKIQWEHKDISDASYRYSEPLKIQLEKGKHELLIQVREGSFLLGNLSLSAPKTIETYTGSQKAEGYECIVIQGEDFYERNDSSIHAACEFDASLFPISTRETVLNTVDADSFNEAGQRITYQFDVEQEGYFYLGMNYRQSDKSDFPVFVDVRVDGNIPNTAFQSYPVKYTTEYKTASFQDEEGKKLSVYLSKGVHSISFTISAEYLRHAMEKVDEIMNGVNDLSLEVTKVAGTNKDKYRDLKITRYIPDIQSRLYGWADELYEISEAATKFVDADDPEDVAAFGYLIIAAKQLKSLGDEPNELVYRVDELSTSSNSINTQMANFVDQIGKNNLSIDRIYVYQEDAKLPKKPGFFKRLGILIKRFFYSFFGQSYSTNSMNKDHVQVWVNRPRQYVEIMQKMIDEEFTPQTGIAVDLALMTDANKLVLSNASGDTPDIATGINYSIPFELGIREALVDLTKFDNYKEVFGRYDDGILVSSVIGDKLISLPETMNFYVLFYRTDILNKLGLTAPNTLDEMVAMLPDLQMRGLNIYYQTAAMMSMRNFHGTTPILFQNHGRLYGKTALDIEIGTEESVKGLTQLTELFTLYDLPVDVPNFYQHFRNGDLPIGIADFNAYNLIQNAAPEIANSWSIALVPGVVDQETGEVLRYMSGGAESTVMFHSNEEREQKAWSFMEWWSRAQTQAEFGQRIQIMYGDEYIWPTANLEAFVNLPFPSSDKAIILEQASYILEAPRLLGSYMMERELSNAFNDVVVNGETLRSRIDDVEKVVDRETKRKLEEFGYIDSEGNIMKEYEVPTVEKVREILSR